MVVVTEYKFNKVIVAYITINISDRVKVTTNKQNYINYICLKNMVIIK